MPMPNAMLRGAFTFNLLVLLIANLAPLAGVYFLGWSAFDILILFWAENLVIGAFTVARMATRFFAGPDIAAIILIPFFIVHYGAFCLGHGLLLLTLFGPPELKPPRHAPELLDLFMPVLDALKLIPNMKWAFMALAASQLIAFLVKFLWQGEFRRTTAQQLMGEPYPRIVMLHVAMLFGAVIAMRLGNPFYAAAMLILLKTAGEVAAFLRENRSGGGTGSGRASVL